MVQAIGEQVVVITGASSGIGRETASWWMRRNGRPTRPTRLRRGTATAA